MARQATRNDDGLSCCPDCDVSLFQGTVQRPPLWQFRWVGTFRRRMVADCRECGQTFETPQVTQ